MLEREWIIRNLDSGDERQLRKLTEKVFKRKLSREYWNWEFRENPSGSTQAFVAVVGDEIVGQYAVLPVRLKVWDKVISGTIGVDAMTHPSYRQQGMFVELANVLYDALAKRGFPITYAFPNDASAPVVFNKLNWIHVCSLPIYIRPLNFSKIVQRFISRRLLQSFLAGSLNACAKAFLRSEPTQRRSEYKISWIKRFDDRVNSLWRRESEEFIIAVIRDQAYLNWRFCDNPERDYRVIIIEKGHCLLGYMVLRIQERFGLSGGMIVDFVVNRDRGQIFQLLVHEALDFFEREHVDLVACMLSGNRRYLQWLRKSRFFLLPKKLGFKEWYFGIRLVDDSLDNETMSNSSNWFLNFGDTDVV